MSAKNGHKYSDSNRIFIKGVFETVGHFDWYKHGWTDGFIISL
jgi:hypothetical protein